MIGPQQKAKEGKPCPFCLENGLVEVVAQTELAYLIKPNNSEMPGCFLVIPKKHIEHMTLLPDMWQQHVNLLVQRVPGYSQRMSFNFSLNQGTWAGQKVDHIHWWLIPRDPESDSNTGAFQVGAATAIARLRSQPARPSTS